VCWEGEGYCSCGGKIGEAGCLRACGLLGVDQRWGESLQRLMGIKGGLVAGWQGGNAGGHCSDGCGHVGDCIFQAVGHLKQKVKRVA